MLDEILKVFWNLGSPASPPKDSLYPKKAKITSLLQRVNLYRTADGYSIYGGRRISIRR